MSDEIPTVYGPPPSDRTELAALSDDGSASNIATKDKSKPRKN